jgi:hypothetical protein
LSANRMAAVKSKSDILRFAIRKFREVAEWRSFLELLLL